MTTDMYSVGPFPHNPFFFMEKHEIKIKMDTVKKHSCVYRVYIEYISILING